jgi:capsid assembly protease
MHAYAHLAERYFNTPLLLTPSAADITGAYLLARISGEIGTADAQELTALSRPLDRAIAASERKPYTIDQGIAIVGVDGKLVNKGGYVGASSGVTSYEGIAAQLHAADKDSAVTGILIEANSPGGEVAGLAGLAQQMRALQKPLWTIANSSAASAMYWIGSIAQRFAVVPDGMAGSIGAVIVMRDLSKAMDRAGIGATVIRSGVKKAQYTGMEPITQDMIDRAQQLVDAANNDFVAHVSATRGISEKAIRALEGEMLTAAEAKAAKLVDVIATVNDFHLSMVAAMRKGSAAGNRSKSSASATLTQPPKQKGPTMDEDTVITAAQLDAARAEGNTTGQRAGATAERTRIGAILNSPQATGRTKLAHHLAFNTGIGAEDAVATLSAAEAVTTAPAAAASNPLGAPANLLAAAMAGINNPAVGASHEPTPTDTPTTPEAKAAVVRAEAESHFGKPVPGIR